MIDDWLLANDGTIDEASFGSLHDWAHGGRMGNWLTVNGESLPTIEVAKNSRIRLRLINRGQRPNFWTKYSRVSVFDR